MSDIALHLVDRVFPQVPVRQWVLSLPRKLRYIFARDAKLLSAGLRIFASEVFRHIRKASGVRPRGRALPGGVTSIQRHGGALNLNVHFHSLFLDGVYVADPRTGVLEFAALPEPTEEELFIVVRRTSGRIQEMLRRKSVVLYPNAEEQEEESTGEQELFQTLQGAAVAEWAVMGDQPHPIELDGRRKGPPPPWIPKPCTATCDEFSLNAGVRIGEGNREGLENLCRYVLRPAFSQERLERLPDGRIRYSFRKPRFNGATSVTLKPLEFMACPPKLHPQGERRREKLAALVPPPRTHLVVYHGLLGPRNRLRSRVVPKAAAPVEPCTHDPDPAATPKLERPRPQASIPKTPPAPPAPVFALLPEFTPTAPLFTGGTLAEPVHAPRRSRQRTDWATLLKRTFEMDVLQCPNCRGRMQVIATIEEPEVIRRILTSMNLPTSPPRAPPARPLREPGGFDFDQAG